ncbi:MAG: hypothetical protein G3I10_01335 [Ferrovum sp.]|nr:hypothetical protein [Ferrovum sp.]
MMESFYKLLDWTLDGMRPLARFIGYERLEKPVAAIERGVKGLLFDCRMCGACVLSANGMACPMNCPKAMRNGPCGGVRQNGNCEIAADMPCVWVEGWKGAQHMRDRADPQSPNAPVEYHYAGKSSWLRVLRQEPWPTSLLTQAPRSVQASSAGGLEALLREGIFVTTSECSPPDSADPADVLRLIHHFEDYVDALNVTDAPGAHCHMSSLGVSLILAKAGWEPVMQIACRDRNRIAIQGDILSAAALGVHNLLCLTGDGIGNGDDPGAKPVFDLDAVSLLDTARRLRDDGMYRSGRKLVSRPRMFLGAVDNPFVPPFDLRPMRLAKKITAGAQFVQTQYCFDVLLLEQYMARVRDEGLDRQCFILVGVGPVVSPRAAHWMRTHVPGVHIPDELIRRLEQAADAEAEGVRICVDTIQRIRAIKGVAGIHLMASKKEHLIGEIVNASGLRAQRAPPSKSKGGSTCHLQD